MPELHQSPAATIAVLGEYPSDFVKECARYAEQLPPLSDLMHEQPFVAPSSFDIGEQAARRAADVVEAVILPNMTRTSVKRLWQHVGRVKNATAVSLCVAHRAGERYLQQLFAQMEADLADSNHDVQRLRSERDEHRAEQERGDGEIASLKKQLDQLHAENVALQHQLGDQQLGGGNKRQRAHVGKQEEEHKQEEQQEEGRQQAASRDDWKEAAEELAKSVMMTGDMSQELLNLQRAAMESGSSSDECFALMHKFSPALNLAIEVSSAQKCAERILKASRRAE